MRTVRVFLPAAASVGMSRMLFTARMAVAWQFRVLFMFYYY